MFPPPEVAFQLIFEFHAIVRDEAFCQTECHRGVVGPLTGFEAEGATAHDVGEWFKGSSWFEFYGGAKGIATSEAEEGAAVFVFGDAVASRWGVRD